MAPPHRPIAAVCYLKRTDDLLYLQFTYNPVTYDCPNLSLCCCSSNDPPSPRRRRRKVDLSRHTAGFLAAVTSLLHLRLLLLRWKEEHLSTSEKEREREYRIGLYFPTFPPLAAAANAASL